MILPEDVINNYPFEGTEQLDKLKTFLIHYYNSTTLRKYKECNEFMSELEIYAKMPNKIIEFYTTNNNTTTPNIIVNNSIVNSKIPKNTIGWEYKFAQYITDKYVTSLTPDTKFKDIMIDFADDCKVTVKSNWGKEYEMLCNNLNIKYEKIVDPRYKGSSGTCYLYLKLQQTQQPSIIDKKFTGLIPNIPLPPKAISMIPFIPKADKTTSS